MTDKRELLELAARACGWIYHPAGELDVKTDKAGWIDPVTGSVYWEDLWDPTLDDGDCAQLEDAVDLDVNRGDVGIFVSQRDSGDIMYEAYADHNGNKGAARRLASTRAAAEVGRGMKS